MSNWFKKLFGGKTCCQKTDETANSATPAPMNMDASQATKPEEGQPTNVEKPQ
ncbi:MAG: hypothetical protein WC905_04705 [Patescibacteria group bacterium]|jgi:hypothetical protein